MNDHIWNYVVNKKCDIFNFSIVKNSSAFMSKIFRVIYQVIFVK